MLQLKYLNQSEAAACFTLNAARSIGLTDRGEIKPGKRADVTIFDRDHQVRMTLVNGRIVYQSQPYEEVVPALV
jgi:N-acetylglucosamine-6-phosphate deacetylase